MSRIPSISALRALECFARHGTVWAAAEELNLTRSAVSHQLRLLERDLGFDLFSRKGTRIELTPRGRGFAGDVRVALDKIAGSAARNVGHGLTGTLTISCTPGFAAFWLAPRIADFRATVRRSICAMVTPGSLTTCQSPDADIFIAFGTRCAGGGRGRAVARYRLRADVSPVLANQLGGIETPRGRPAGGPSAPGRWRGLAALAAGRRAAGGRGGSWARIRDMNLVYAATVAGQGVSMGDEFISNAAMETGQLIRVTDMCGSLHRMPIICAHPHQKATLAARWSRSVAGSRGVATACTLKRGIGKFCLPMGRKQFVCPVGCPATTLNRDKETP